MRFSRLRLALPDAGIVDALYFTGTHTQDGGERKRKDRMITSHKLLIEDKVRCESYQKAIRQVVKEGDVVVDVGTGSGLLAFFAIQAGARKVYAIEGGDIIDDAKKIAKINGLYGKIDFIKGISTEVNLPEKADVLVSELIGSLALEEDILKYLIDAKKRFLKEKGVIIPSYIDIHVAPVEAASTYEKEITFWNKNLYGIDFQKGREEAVNSRFIQLIDPRGILAEPAKLHYIDFCQVNEPKGPYIDNSVAFKIERGGILHGFCGWFSAKLSKGVMLSNSPHNRPTHWKQNFFPIQNPVHVKKGDAVRFKMNVKSFSHITVWSWIVEIKEKIIFSHSTFKSLPITKDCVLNTEGW